MKWISSSRFQLSGGREVSANGGYVGIARDADGTLRLAEGYDGILVVDQSCYGEDVPWTPAERRELADAMIALWRAFGDGDPAR